MRTAAFRTPQINRLAETASAEKERTRKRARSLRGYAVGVKACLATTACKYLKVCDQIFIAGKQPIFVEVDGIATFIWKDDTQQAWSACEQGAADGNTEAIGREDDLWEHADLHG